MRKQLRHKYSWIPDVPDFRDLPYQAALTPKDLPPKVDLRPQCSLIEYQDELGSCTAHALVSVMEYNDKKPDGKWTDLSRLFLYYNERFLEGHTRWDTGAQLRTGIKALTKYGVCVESLWPYTIARYRDTPPQPCYKDARRHTISAYQRIGYSVPQMMDCLATRGPFVFGVPIYQSFESPFVAQTGKVPMPQKGERMLGGHAMCAVGYDKERDIFIVRNSWGGEWGMQGYCEMPVKYLETMAEDMWSILK